MSKDVHTEHCCSKHGCKYSDPDCTVTIGDKPQSFPCEYCAMDDEVDKHFRDELEAKDQIIAELVEALGRLDVCLSIQQESWVHAANKEAVLQEGREVISLALSKAKTLEER